MASLTPDKAHPMTQSALLTVVVEFYIQQISYSVYHRIGMAYQ
jgi:hypothetical protein